MLDGTRKISKNERIDLLENRLEDLEIAVAKGYIENVEDLTAIQNQLIVIRRILEVNGVYHATKNSKRL